MADKYIDHGARPAYAATPTWNVPQEGDGTASGTGACSIASVVFTQGHSAGSVAVLGATVTPATSADAAAAANNLATAINASTAAVSSTWAGGKTPQLRNMVYARGPATGAPAGTCEIMTRVASASPNDTGGNTSLTQASYNGTPPTLTQFASGAGGAWGYITNTGTLWPQGYGAATYGLWHSQTLLAGTLAGGDTCYIRTKRSGANITATMSTNNVTMEIPAGAPGSPVVFVFDAGVTWAGDSGVFKFSLNSVNHFWRGDASCSGDSGRAIAFIGTQLTDTTRNAVFELTAEYATANFYLPMNTAWVNCEFFRPASVNDWNNNFSFGGDYTNNANTVFTGPMVFRGCIFRQGHANAATILRVGAYASKNLLLEGCRFIATTQTVANGAAIFAAADVNNPGGPVDMTFRACIASGYYAGSSVGSFHTAVAAVNTSLVKLIKFENCDLGNVSLYNFNILGNATVGPVNGNTPECRFADDASHRALVTTSAIGRRFRYETMHFLVEWNPSSTWPLLRAQLPEAYNGAEDRWVYRVATSSVAGYFSTTAPREVLRFTKYNTLADGARTLTMEFLVDQQIDVGGTTLKNSDVVLQVVYTDASGVLRTERSYVIGDTVANAASSSAGWTATQYDIASVPHYYNKRKVSFATAQSVKTGTEMFFSVHIGRPGPTANDWYFIDPDVDVA